MADNTIILKRSAVGGKVPTTGSLALGEIALNTFDGKLFFKKNNGTESIVELGKFAITAGDLTAVDNGGGNYTLTVKDDAVTFAKIQDIPTNTLLGRVSANTGDVEALTAAQIRSFLNVSQISGNEGTVKSVDISLPDLFNVSGGPVTTTGTITATLKSQNANTVFSGPASGTGAPSFRALAASDIPGLDWSKVVSGKPTTLSGYGITDAVTANGPITAGTATKISYDSRGLVTGGGSLIATDIPNIDWAKITSGKPTTLAGYGITNAVTANANITGGTFAKITFDAKGLVTAGASLAAADIPSLDWNKITSGKPTTLAGYGITNAVTANTAIVEGIFTKVMVDAKGLVTLGDTLDPEDIPNLDWSKIVSGKPTTISGYGITITAADVPNIDWNKITSGKPTTLAGYGITDAAGASTVVLLTGNQTIAGNKTFDNNVTVNGDLIVNGATTTIDATNLAVSDAVIQLARGNSTASAPYVGLQAERGGTDAWILFNEGNDRWGVYTGADTAALTLTAFEAANFYGVFNGNATTATTLQTARTINGVSFNGSANITVADATKLPLTGGTMTGALLISNAAPQFHWVETDIPKTWIGVVDGGTWDIREDSTSSANTRLTIKAGAKKLTLDTVNLVWGTDNIYHAGNLTNLNQLVNGPGFITASDSITGNAATATALQTARTINGVSFNGTANITVADNTKVPLTGGILTGKLTFELDHQDFFTVKNNATTTNTAAFTWRVENRNWRLWMYGADAVGREAIVADVNTGVVRLIAGSTVGTDAIYHAGNLTNLNQLINGPGFITAADSITGNAATATALQTARTINGVSFNGTANITVTANTPNTLTRGTYLTGSDFNGGAATTWAVDATSLNTALKIVVRDGSGNFSAGTITAALTGNASTATALQTARTINGVSFNGTANITVADATKLPLTGGTLTGALTIAANYPNITFNNNDGLTNQKTARFDYEDGRFAFQLLQDGTTTWVRDILKLWHNGAVDVYGPLNVSTGDLNIAAGGKIYIGGVEFKGGGGSPWTVKTAAYTAVAGDRILANTSSGGFTITLPAVPALGDEVIIADDGNFATNNLIIGRNGRTINGVADNLELDIAGVRVHLVYDGVTWENYFDSVATGTNSGFATVATSGSYNDLLNKPTIPTLPPLALVATTGSYADLSDKPAIPAAQTLASLGAVADNNGVATNIELRASRVRAETAFSGSGAVTLNYNNGDYRKVTATGAITITLSNMPGTGQVGSYMVEATNWGAFQITHPAGTKFAGGVAPTFTTSGIDIVTYLVDGTNVIRCLLSAKDVK